MSWRDAYRTASFRGVEFKVASHEASGGRRLNVAEFPGRDFAGVQDLGRRVRRFDVEAYLVGEDYHLERDNLLAAVSQPGPGELVHPYLGTHRVGCETYRLRETKEDGSVCVLALQFVEWPDRASPVSSVNPTAIVERAGEPLLAAAVDDFGGSLGAVDVPRSAQEAAAAEWTRIAEAFEVVTLHGPAEVAAAWVQSFRDLTDAALALVAAPNDFAYAVQGILREFDDALGSAEELFRLYLGLGHEELDRPAPILAGGSSADEGALALRLLVVRTVAAGAARGAARVEWETYDDAVKARNELADLLDRLADAEDYGAFDGLEGLRASLVAAIPPESADLPRIGTVRLDHPTPSLVLAYRLYDRVDRAGDIVKRNAVAHPGFLPVVRDLEVLLDVEART